MFSSFSLPFSLPSWGGGRGDRDGKGSMALASVEIHDSEQGADRRTRRLQSLIKLNHANHSIIYNNLRFHNHTPHILGSAYILGGTAEQLTRVYEAESASLEPWKESPGEISKDDWRDYLGKPEYQRAYVDFFEDQLVSFGYDWRKMLEHYLFEGDEPLVNSLLCGLAHPMIHLGYAYELSNRIVGVEALGLACCFYDPLHKYIDDPRWTFEPSYKTKSPLEILQRMTSDDRLDTPKVSSPGAPNIDTLLAAPEHERILLDHWNAWQVDASDLDGALHAAQTAAAALVVGTRAVGAREFDFFLLHALTSSHAVRILLPLVPARFRLGLVRQWFLFAVLAHAGQMRPTIDTSLIEDFEPKTGEDSWRYVVHAALDADAERSTDAHFVKGLRALRVADETWGAQKGWWLKAACRLAADFDGWGGAAAAAHHDTYGPRRR